MADYLIQDTTLTEIADAIRSKTGSTDAIAIKDMASKINNMETFLDYENTYVTSISKCEYVELDKFKSVSFPNVTEIGSSAFYSNSNLVVANFPSVTKIGNSAFLNCKNIIDINLPLAKTIGSACFRYCSSLIDISLPECEIIYDGAFMDCASLTSVDLTNIVSIQTNAFSRCNNLNTLILRNEKFVGISIMNNLSNTPIASDAGCIYVPDSLVDSYKTDVNWSVYASQIKPLSEYVEE